MKPSKHVGTNMLIIMILVKIHLFFISPTGSTVAMQQEDGDPWTNRIIEEINDSDH